MNWQTSRFSIALDRPLVMGIVNATPDSFSDGGRYAHSARALQHCEQLIKDGADILDIGGESTRPGSPAVGLEEELARVLPVVRGAVSMGVPVSVDTYKPGVMQAVLDLGAGIINDIWGPRPPGAKAGVASAPSCLRCLPDAHAPRSADHASLAHGWRHCSSGAALPAGVCRVTARDGRTARSHRAGPWSGFR